MKFYRQQFSNALDQPRSSAVKCTALIASTPRCGNHLRGHAMASTGLLGLPFEDGNPANLTQWSRTLGTVSPNATIAALMKRWISHHAAQQRPTRWQASRLGRMARLARS